MWSASIEILNPYEATIKSICKEIEKEKEKRNIDIHKNAYIKKKEKKPRYL